MNLNYQKEVVFLIVVIAIGVGGCLGNPMVESPSQTEQVDILVNNSANSIYAFEVYAAEGELNNNEVVIEREGRISGSVSPGQGLSSYGFSPIHGNVTSIQISSNQSRFIGRYDLNPGEQENTSIDGFETGDTVVVSIRNESGVVGLVAANCDENDLTVLSVTMRSYGSDSGYSCV